MSATMPDPDDYVLGEPHPNTLPTATFETKPSHPDYTGGGYEHSRSTEYRPHTPGDQSESVYASIHRLCAVAWCFPDEWTAADILPEMRGMDIHHNAPETDGDWGVPWDNRECVLEPIEHGRHSEITQTQRRAWAEDAKHEVREREQAPLPDPDADECDGCGRETAGPLGTSDDWEGQWCVECITDYRERQEAMQELEDLQL